MEALSILADGDEGVRKAGAVEYFEGFYDVAPHRDDGGMSANSAISLDEAAMLRAVSKTLDDACDAVGEMDEDALIATGWPRRIQPLARQTLESMALRGHFSEDVEEAEPSMRRPNDGV